MVRGRAAVVAGLAAALLIGAWLSGPLAAGATSRGYDAERGNAGAGWGARGHVDKPDRVSEHPCESNPGWCRNKPAWSVRPSDGPTSDDVTNGAVGFGGSPEPVVGQSSGEPSVGGAPATTNGADGSEAVQASTAPTPPNGAEPPAAASPDVADTSPPPSADDPVTTDAVAAAPAPSATPPPPDSGLLDELTDPLGAAGPKPVATGLSRDTTRGGVLVALLAFAVLLFLVGYQMVDRRDPRRDSTRDTEAVARFR